MIDYDTRVYCSRCELTHLRSETKLIPNWGYKCNQCGNKCRVKPKYTNKKYNETHPFIPCGRVGRSAIRTEIKLLAQETRME